VVAAGEKDGGDDDVAMYDWPDLKKRSPYGLGWNVKPRQKGTLWLRFLTEAKSYDFLASPQYASVPEPVQNIENNRYQKPFLLSKNKRLKKAVMYNGK